MIRTKNKETVPHTELVQTYAMLFRPPMTAKDHSRLLGHNHDKYGIHVSGADLKDHEPYRYDPFGRGRKMLSIYDNIVAPENLLRMHCGPEKQSCILNTGPWYNRIFKSRQPLTQPCADIGQTHLMKHIIDRGPPYSLDMLEHISAAVGIPLEDDQLFTSYNLFGDRLRQLQCLLDERKPHGLKQVWKDNRDSMAFYTFWAVIVFGAFGVILSIFGLAVSIVQTVGTFQSIRGP